MSSLLTESRFARFGRWLAAGFLIAAIHVGGGALALLKSPVDAAFEEPQGAILVDFAPVAASADSRASDAPPGPEAEESAPTPAMVEEQLEAADIDMPELAESPLAPDPEVVLPRREVVEVDSEKEVEELAAAQPQLVAPSDAAPETTAPPRIEGVVAHEVAATQIGMTDAQKKAQQSWQGSLRSHLEGHKRYPAAARAQGAQGEARMRFTIDRGGYVIDARIVKSSGSALLDREALATIERASPLPEPPRHLGAATFDFVIPIQFSMR